MPATMESQGTDRYLDFEERRYNVRVQSLKSSIAPQDERPQYEWNVALEGSSDPQTGLPLTVKFWTSQIWNDGNGTESHLVLVARGLVPGITKAEFERMDFPDFEGLRGSAIAKLNPKGYPAIDKTTFKTATGTKNPQASLPAAAPSTSQSAQGLASPAKIKMLHMSAEEYEVSAEALASHISTYYHGKRDVELTKEEVETVIRSIEAQEIAPF